MSHPQEHATVGLRTPDPNRSPSPVRFIDRRFLSVTLDYACLLGAPWWEGTRRTRHSFGEKPATPVDLDNRALRRYARALAPAYLRLGGSESDRVRYAVGDAGTAARERPPARERASVRSDRKPGLAAPGPDYRSVLTGERWDELSRFAWDVGFDLVVTLNAGPGPRGRDGSWNPDNARALVAHAARRNQAVSVWELGNEVNGFPFIHGLARRVSARQYAADFAVFAGMVRELSPHARTAGPASAYWPLLGEVLPMIPRFLKRVVRAPAIVTWHYYPQQSSRGVVASRRADPFAVLKPRRLDGTARWARRVSRHARRFGGATTSEVARRRPEVWLGETGHALYGGEVGVSDRFVASLWWMDHLGLMARSGVRVVMRQSLVGGDYGLLDPHTLEPRPDYWSSLLWTALMGEAVYATHTRPSRKLRVYAHGARHRRGAISVLIINLSGRSAAAVSVETGSLDFTPRHLEVFTVTASDPFSTSLLINGEKPRLPATRGTPPAAPHVQAPDDAVAVPPLSYSFVVCVP